MGKLSKADKIKIKNLKRCIRKRRKQLRTIDKKYRASTEHLIELLKKRIREIKTPPLVIKKYNPLIWWYNTKRELK